MTLLAKKNSIRPSLEYASCYYPFQASISAKAVKGENLFRFYIACILCSSTWRFMELVLQVQVRRKLQAAFTRASRNIAKHLRMF